MPTILLSDVFNGTKEYPILDVRSESEFEQGHIPGSLNIPLLNNADRKEVGICYKNQGNEAAVILGYKLAGPKFYTLIQQVKKKVPGKKLFMHCWRGGLRSKIYSDLLENAGFEVSRIQGGYKVYRHWVLQILEKSMPIHILGGLTGSGKTELLHLLSSEGEQIIDLEGLAKHKGSAFGGLGQLPQPTQEQFENNLANCINVIDPGLRVWVEDESRAIGKIVIPSKLWEQMREAELYEIVIPYKQRLERIIKEYGHFDIALLAEKTFLLGKRLGDKRTKELILFLHEKKLKEWAMALLEYYDKTYEHGQNKRESLKRKQIELNSPMNNIAFIHSINQLKSS